MIASFFKNRFVLRCLIVFLFFIYCPIASADLNINILAVNGTDESRDKDVTFSLPKELGSDDILDTAGLKLDYDFNKGCYFVHGKVELNAKETKTFKVRIRDVWQVDQEKIEKIKEQIEVSLKGIKDTDYEENASKKKEALLERLDYILEQQERYADNVEKRMDQYRIYEEEIQEVREKAVSIDYWRSKNFVDESEQRTVRFVIKVENPSKSERKTLSPKHYLPKEVKEEHFIDTQGFDVRYDVSRSQCYLTKEESFLPAEVKKYNFTVTDIWYIAQPHLEDLKDRTKKAYKLLKETKYATSARYLVQSIKENIERIEYSQEQEKDIDQHISTYRKNIERFETAKKDVEALENLLKALRENLERSRLKNVLQKIRTFKNIASIAAAIFNKKPKLNTAWKIIIGVVSFVGLLTFLHFVVWGKRSRTLKVEKEEPEDFEKVAKEAEGKNKEQGA